VGDGSAGKPDTAAGRRAMFPMTDNSFIQLNPAGLAVFGQTVDYIAGAENSTFPEVLAQWTFPTENAAGLDATFRAPEIGTTGITAGNLTANVESPGSYPTAPVLRVFPNDNNDLSEAVANDGYVEFSLESVGNSLELTGITFDAARGGGSTPRGFGLASSLDGFTSIIDTANIPTTRSDFTNFLVDLSGLGFDAVTEEITFRMYLYSPSNGSTIEIDNLTMFGTVRDAVIPEPAALMIWSLLAGLGLGMGWRRRK